MPAAPSPSGSSPSLRKAAILLVSLGEQASAELIKRLPEKEIERVSQEVAGLGAVSGEEAEKVLKEFYLQGKSSSGIGRGGFEYTRKMLVSAFGPEGPSKCSGLDVMRYDADSLHAEFGARFRLMESSKELHRTPLGTTQQFLYCYYLRV